MEIRNDSDGTICEAIGKRTTVLARQKGLTQHALADLVGTGQKTIYKIENGNPATKIETIFSIIASLDLELAVGPRQKNDASENWADYL